MRPQSCMGFILHEFDCMHILHMQMNFLAKHDSVNYLCPEPCIRLVNHSWSRQAVMQSWSVQNTCSIQYHEWSIQSGHLNTISYRQHSAFCWQVNSLLKVEIILEILVNWRQLLQTSALRVHSEVLNCKPMAYKTRTWSIVASFSVGR